MAIVGIRAPRPRLHTDYQISLNTALNVTTKIELYLSKTQLKLRIFSYLHIVGEHITEYDSQQLTGRTAQETPNEQPQSIRISSRFDFENNLFKVVSVNSDSVQALSLWGDNVGQTILFPDVEQVVQLVNEKRG